MSDSHGISPMIRKLNNSMRWCIRFHRLVLSLPMSSMNLWVIQGRRGRLLSVRDFAQDLSIFFEQAIDHLGNLVGQAAHHNEFAFVGSRAFVPAALDRNQALVELGPFTVLLLDGLWLALDNWLSDLADNVFVTLLPLLRRAFTGFHAPERQKMGEKVKYLRSKSQAGIHTTGEQSTLCQERADLVLPILAHILGVKFDGN